jgi:hypothetical protein
MRKSPKLERYRYEEPGTQARHPAEKTTFAAGKSESRFFLTPICHFPSNVRQFHSQRHVMWIKLTGEFVNLDHIVRVKVSKSFKNTAEEIVVELEGVVKGELTHFTRYRGVDAEIVLHALEILSRLETAPAGDVPNRQTLHDVKIL